MVYTAVAGYCLFASWKKKHMKYDFNNKNTESKIRSILLFLLVSYAILQVRQSNKVTPHCSETGKNLTKNGDVTQMPTFIELLTHDYKPSS